MRVSAAALPGTGVQALGAWESCAELRRGLERDQIAVRFQPIVRLADRRPVMVEALARWQLPTGEVQPADFVPLAECCGLLRPLSAAIAARLVRDLAPFWPRLRLSVALNLPLAVLLQRDLSVWLYRILAGSPLRRRGIVVELTETDAMHDRAALRRALHRLRRCGHRVLLDDLTLRDKREGLLALGFAGAKLDRALVESLPRSAGARMAVRRLARRCAARGQTLTAEGVSDARLWACVRALGVHRAQGFSVGRPLAAAALPGWSADWRGAAGQRLAASTAAISGSTVASSIVGGVA